MTPTRCRVLCVDDNEDTSFMLRTLLGATGYEVETAAGVAEALERARDESFDLFVIDNRYPDGTGAELCRALRQARPATGVIFYTGAAYAADRQQGLAAGADAYIVKPAITELLDAVEQALTPEPCAATSAA